MDWIAGFYKWYFDIMIAVFMAGWTMITDVCFWFLEQLMGIILFVLSQFGAMPGADMFQDAISMLPPEAFELAYLLRIPEASAVVVSAVVVRIILQLIPVVRLGS